MKFLFLCSLICCANAQISVIPIVNAKYDFTQTVIWSPLIPAALLKQSTISAKTDATNNLTILKGEDHFIFRGKDHAELYKVANAETKQRWDFPAFASTASAHNPNQAILAILHKTVRFKIPFERSHSIPMEFVTHAGPEDVQFYGTANTEMFSHVKVLHHNSENKTCALMAECITPEERVVFYIPEKNRLFSEACDTLRPLIKAADEAKGKQRNHFKLELEDVILIPYITVHVSTDFAPLLRKMQEPPITTAQQKIFLQFDQLGSAKSYGDYLSYDTSSDPFDPNSGARSRIFRFNEPFFLMLWRKQDAWPYLAIWVGDTSALQHWHE